LSPLLPFSPPLFPSSFLLLFSSPLFFSSFEEGRIFKSAGFLEAGQSPFGGVVNNTTRIIPGSFLRAL
jgi:hypothetical protein